MFKDLKFSLYVSRTFKKAKLYPLPFFSFFLCVFVLKFAYVFVLVEIISKVKDPPPLCRPIISVEEAPLDVIQLMKQAWSEDPEKRPTFEEIFKQVKSEDICLCESLW